jgi:formate dehydrogenase subunit beta
MINKVKAWLEDGTIDIFLGYKETNHHPLPHCFTQERIEEVEDLVLSPVRYSLEKIATHMAAVEPDIKIGLLARDCNDRALNILYLWNQLNPDNLSTLTVNCCPSKLKDHGDCSYLEPEKMGAYKKQVGVDNHMALEDLDSFGQKNAWTGGCTNFKSASSVTVAEISVPVCFCKECSLEHDELVKTGPLLPEVPIFHMVRAVHMAGRCIDCGLCEAACPMDIPLRLLYGRVNEIVRDLFDYETGSSASSNPFSILGDTVTLEPKPIGMAKTVTP